MADLAIYRTSRCCALVTFIKYMLIEGVYSVICTPTRQDFWAIRSFPFSILQLSTLPSLKIFNILVLV